MTDGRLGYLEYSLGYETAFRIEDVNERAMIFRGILVDLSSNAFENFGYERVDGQLDAELRLADSRSAANFGDAS